MSTPDEPFRPPPDPPPAYRPEPPYAERGHPPYPGPGYPPYGDRGYPPYPPPRGTNGFAVASLVLGILWLFWLGSLLALVFGYVAKRQIRESAEGGDGLATAGIVLGWVGAGTFLLVALAGFGAGVGTPVEHAGTGVVVVTPGAPPP